MSQGTIVPTRREGAARRRRAGSGWLLAALVVVLPAAALAKRVAVAAFEGPHAAEAEKAVTQVLIKDGHEIVGAAEWKAALAEVGAKGTPEEAIAAAARKAKVSAVVLGTVKPGPKRARSAALEIVVHDGKTGSRLEGVEVPLKRGRVDAAAVTQITLSLPPVIPLGQDPVAAAASAQAPTDGDSPEALAARRAARQAASAPVAAPVQRRRTIVVGGAGLNFWGRRLDPKPAGNADAYSGGPMPPGIHLEVEGYPAAAFMSGIAGDFGVGAYFDQAWLKSRFPGATGTVNVSSTQTRGGVDLRFRRELGTGPFSPTVRGALSFAYTGFKLSASDRALISNLNLPDATLYGFGPSVGAIVPLGRPWLRAGASFGFLYVMGPNSNAPAGGKYDNGWGIDTVVHADYLPLRWLLVRAQLGVTYYGNSIKSTAPARTTGLADTYFSGLLTASYVY